MSNIRVDSAWLDNFIASKGIEVTKDYGFKKVVKCFLPTHKDNNASAAIFDSGVYHCSGCGVRFHLSKIDPSVPLEMVEAPQSKNYSPVLNFDVESNPEHYVKYPGVIRAANIRDGVLVGVQERWEGAGYFCEGEPGFRLHDNIITESITDAILLIENGIPAGSICSAANWRMITGKIYVPQIDKRGLSAAKEISRRNIVFSWNSSYAKDIRELNETDLELIVGKLRLTL